jgi:glycosyltransferase involved in cell wall biosynthesis
MKSSLRCALDLIQFIKPQIKGTPFLNWHKVVITMDADLQDSPRRNSGLYNMITSQNFDLVSGWKKSATIQWLQNLPSKLFNWAARKTSGVELNDFNCGLKAYKI